MEADGSSGPPAAGKSFKHWLGVLRPLSWWLLLVLIMFGYRKHQELMEQTRLNFSVKLEGRPVTDEAVAGLDQVRIESGDKLSLGRHNFVITHPKAEPFSTKLSIWYGPHDLGEIVLKRSMGTLAVQTIPSAGLLTVRGPEFNLILTNSFGITSSVPTDVYQVSAKYDHLEQSSEVSVFSGSIGSWRFAPRLGALSLACNRGDASFQLLAPTGELVVAGGFPLSISELPEGAYKIVAQHHGNRKNVEVVVSAGATNEFPVDFIYGTATFETEHPGATVVTSDGRELGVTPLTLPELQPGTYEFALRQQGYEPMPVSLVITPNQTTLVHTNMVNSSYAGAVNAARQFLVNADYDRALDAIAEALRIQPGDPIAVGLHAEAVGRRSLKAAQAMGQQGNYTGAIKELESALKALPDNEEAKELLADYTKREAERAEERRQERLNRPQRVFDAALTRYPDANLFDSHELKTGKSEKDIQSSISNALQHVTPNFRVERSFSPKPETFEIIAVEEIYSGLIVGGIRRCVIVGGQTRDDETKILFKVLEYKTKHNVTVQGLLNFTDNQELIPIHPSRIPEMTEKLQAQLKDGETIVTERIQRAITQTP